MHKIHMVGSAHIDPVWLWRWQEGFAEIKATFRSALDRMKEEPEFIFTCGCASYYEWVEKNEPDLFCEIRERVAEGRWRVVNGWWIQPDCNIPSGESFARHALYSQRYFKEKLGVTAKTGYNVDSFGHNGNLPQLLKLGGMNAYVMMRPQQHEKNLPNVFIWEGNDGTRMPTAKILYSYVVDSDPARIRSRMEELLADTHTAEMPLMMFYGVGNHGGGPTAAQLIHMREIRGELGDGIFEFSDPEIYFSTLDNTTSLPIIHDDLQHHASGCYSTTQEIKSLNRISENRLLFAERMLTTAHAAFGYPYDTNAFRQAWTDVLFNQFHDIMGGCSIREAYEDVREWYGEALSISGRLLNEALQKISWSIDTMGDLDIHPTKEFSSLTWEQESGGVPIVVFNPHAWEVTVPVELPYHQKSITGEHGKAIALQQVRSSRTNGADNHDSVFLATLPSLGYRVFHGRLHSGEDTPKAPREKLYAGNDFISNEFLRVTFDTHTGIVKSLYDIAANCEVFAPGGGCVPVVVDDFRTDTWAHGVFSFRDDIGIFGNARMKVLERGPVRVTMRVITEYGKSELTQDFTLYNGISRLYVKVRLNWQEKNKILKFSFPIRLANPTVTYEIPYGLIERPANGEEEPGHSWVDIGDGEYGLTLANTSKYSYDALGGDLRLTAVRSAIYADHYGERDDMCEHMDIGIQRFSYALSPRTGSLCPGYAVKMASELNLPPVSIFETYHKGLLPLTNSFASVSVPNVILQTLKLAEDRGGYVARLYETDGKRTQARLRLPVIGADIALEFGAYEIRSVYVTRDGTVRTVDFMEWTTVE